MVLFSRALRATLALLVLFAGPASADGLGECAQVKYIAASEGTGPIFRQEEGAVEVGVETDAIGQAGTIAVVADPASCATGPAEILQVIAAFDDAGEGAVELRYLP